MTLEDTALAQSSKDPKDPKQTDIDKKEAEAIRNKLANWVEQQTQGKTDVPDRVRARESRSEAASVYRQHLPDRKLFWRALQRAGGRG